MIYSKEDQLPKRSQIDIHQLDQKWAQAITRKGYCEFCGKRNVRLDAHHVIGRSNKTLRHNLANGCCLCHQCHIEIAHGKPQLFKERLIAMRGQKWWDELQERSYVR